jgi:hypothetical protein
LRNQIQDLQKITQDQSLTIQNLKNENHDLRAQLDQFILKEKNNKQRPSSCLRSSSSSPKKRVAFAKDLTSVKYFSPSSHENTNPCSLQSKPFPSSPNRPESTPRGSLYHRSLRGFLDQKRVQMSKLSIQSFDSQISDYFKERSERLAASMFKE